jgi:hypothetical protein
MVDLERWPKDHVDDIEASKFPRQPGAARVGLGRANQGPVLLLADGPIRRPVVLTLAGFDLYKDERGRVGAKVAADDVDFPAAALFPPPVPGDYGKALFLKIPMSQVFAAPSGNPRRIPDTLTGAMAPRIREDVKPAEHF